MIILASIFVVSSIVGWGVALAWLLMRAVDRGSVSYGLSCFVLLVIPFGILLGYVAGREKAPCAQYETRMMFNPATKTVMPAQFCVMQGEWSK